MDPEIYPAFVDGEICTNEEARSSMAYTKPRAMVTKSSDAMNLESLSDALEDINTIHHKLKPEANTSNRAKADYKGQRDLSSTDVHYVSIPHASQRPPKGEENEEDKALARTIHTKTTTKKRLTANDITKACANLTLTNDPFLRSPPEHFFTETPCIGDLNIPKSLMRQWIKTWFEGRDLSAKELKHYHTFIDKMRPTRLIFDSNKAKYAIPMLNASGLEDSICSRIAEDIYSAREKQNIRLLPLYGALRKAGKMKGPFKLQHICVTYAAAERKREKEQAKKVPKKGASKANAQARRHKKEENRLKIAKENGDTRGKEIVHDRDMDVMMD